MWSWGNIEDYGLILTAAFEVWLRTTLAFQISDNTFVPLTGIYNYYFIFVQLLLKKIYFKSKV